MKRIFVVLLFVCVSICLFAFAMAEPILQDVFAMGPSPKKVMAQEAGSANGGKRQQTPQAQQTPEPQPYQPATQPQAVQAQPPVQAAPPAQPKPATPQAPATQTPAPQPAPPAPQPPQKRGEISFNFDDADVYEVAQTVFADILRANYIIDPKVKGRVTFRTVAPIPRDEVLSVMETILRLNGIGFVFENGIYRIIPLADVSKELVHAQVGKTPEKVAIELFTFKNVILKESIGDIEHAIGLNLQGGSARIIPLYRLNALLVVTSAKEQLEYVRRWIASFDTMFASARPKIFVYPLQNSKAAHIASLLQSIFTGTAAPSTPSRITALSPTGSTTQPTTSTTGTTPAAPVSTPSVAAPRMGASTVAAGTGFLVSQDTRVFADEIANSLIIVATPGDYEFVVETIKKLDAMPRQVMIEALVASVSLKDNLKFGVEWSLRTNINISGLKPFKTPIDLKADVGFNTANMDPTKPAGFSFIAKDSAGVIRAYLEALATEGNLNVLASPHILVSDNREAKIQIGKQVPIATSETVSQSVTPAQTTTTIQYKDIGVILKVKPQISDSGLVAIEVSQEVSDYETTPLFTGSTQIIINKTEAVSNLIAQDGETIVIGGLIQTKKGQQRTGIPLLSKIPVLGYLFGYTEDTDERSEIVILITPRVVKSQADAAAVSSGFMRTFEGANKEIKLDDLIRNKPPKEQK